MGVQLNKSAISQERFKSVYEARCQAHVSTTGRNPSGEQREKFKNDVKGLAMKLNKGQRV